MISLWIIFVIVIYKKKNFKENNSEKYSNVLLDAFKYSNNFIYKKVIIFEIIIIVVLVVSSKIMIINNFNQLVLWS